MSIISNLYDQVVTRVETVLPNHKRLADPYFLEKNTDAAKRKGFGIKIGPGLNTEEQLSCDIIMSQTISIIVARMSTGRELEIEKKADTEKLLLEDFWSIIQDFETDPPLGDSQIIIASSFNGHNGIESIRGAKDNFLFLEGSFNFRFRKDLN